MAWKQVLDAFEMLDTAQVDGQTVAAYLREQSATLQVSSTRVEGDAGHTDFIRALVAGTNGKSAGGTAPTLGIIGRIGGIGARPSKLGFVSDGDGALAAVACAAKLARMAEHGDALTGDVLIGTHICPRALIIPHDPVAFMAAPVDQDEMNAQEVDDRMEAILCVDTTRGNRIVNSRGFAISPTVKDGYILRVSEDLLDVMEVVTGLPPTVFAITQQDITPYANGLHHLNSILQPSTATSAPAVGVALTSMVPVAGSESGASQLADIEAAVRFCLEVAKRFGCGECHFYDVHEFEQLTSRYGAMGHFQTSGLTP